MNEGRTLFVLAAVSGLAVTLFVADLVLPLGMAVWVPYVAVVLLALWFPRPWQTQLTAASCTLLTAVGLICPEPPEGGQFWLSLVNRILGVFAFWVTAFVGLAARRTVELQEANARLQKEIAAKKRTEERLREQASLLDLTQDAIMVRDMEGHILFWNEGAERTYGWCAAEVIGKKFLDIFFQIPPPELEKTNRLLLERGEWSGEWRHITKHGQEIIVASRWTLGRDNEGRPKFQLIVNTDVTEKKRLESQLLRTQRLESVGVLAGGIAHDFNNLLTPILMAVKLLKEKRSEEERQHLLSTVQASSERAATMVRQLLSFAGGGGRPEAMALGPIIREIKAILEHTLPKNIRLEVTLSSSLHEVFGDATQLAQVLMNLCVNARDAMPQGGRLQIFAENIGHDHEPFRVQTHNLVGRYVRLTVTDTGHGIPPQTLDRIFDPFFTTKEQGKGTGLGLSTALGIVKNHRGVLTVSSEVDKGSRFCVYLPIHDAAVVPEPSTRSIGQLSGQGELILVVDDETPILDTARVTLESHGYRVLAASNGREAVDLFGCYREEIQAVILDMMMPGMDGAATLAALRELDPEVRVLATSGLHLFGRVAEEVAVGDTAFLQKPYSDEQLLAILTQVLRTRMRRQSSDLVAATSGH